MKFLHFFLIALFAGGPLMPATGAAPSTDKECVVCGHVCCCPEMCKAELANQRTARKCDGPLQICNARDTMPSTLSAQLSKSDLFHPEIDLSATFDFYRSPRASAARYATKLMGRVPALDIPTPPPRILLYSFHSRCRF